MTYQERKDKAREKAYELEKILMERSCSWGELLEVCSRIESIAKRYGLTREFRNNGVI